MPEERISMTTALRMHTMGSAYAAFEEKVKGSLEPGKMADVVVWSHDLLTASRAELRELRPEMVFINGELVHQKQASGA